MKDTVSTKLVCSEVSQEKIKRDVDIAIEMDPEKKNIHNFLAFKRRLEKELGRKVDLGIEGAMKPEARKFIEKEIIYV